MKLKLKRLIYELFNKYTTTMYEVQYCGYNNKLISHETNMAQLSLREYLWTKVSTVIKIFIFNINYLDVNTLS